MDRHLQRSVLTLPFTHPSIHPLAALLSLPVVCGLSPRTALPRRCCPPQEREFRAHMLHKSLAEWLRGDAVYGERAPPQFVVDVGAGSAMWAEKCAELALGQRDVAAAPDVYGAERERLL